MKIWDELSHMTGNKKYGHTYYTCKLTPKGYDINQWFYWETKDMIFDHEIDNEINVEKGTIDRTTTIYMKDETRYRHGRGKINRNYFRTCKKRITDFMCHEVKGEADQMFGDRLQMLMKWGNLDETKNMVFPNYKIPEKQFEKRIWEL